MLVQHRAEGIQTGDKLIWIYGGAQWRKNQTLSWKLDIMGQPELVNWKFHPEECKSNLVEVAGKNCFVSLRKNTNYSKIFTVTGSCDPGSKVDIGDTFWGH